MHASMSLHSAWTISQGLQYAWTALPSLQSAGPPRKAYSSWTAHLGPTVSTGPPRPFGLQHTDGSLERNHNMSTYTYKQYRENTGNKNKYICLSYRYNIATSKIQGYIAKSSGTTLVPQTYRLSEKNHLKIKQIIQQLPPEIKTDTISNL